MCGDDRVAFEVERYGVDGPVSAAAGPACRVELMCTRVLIVSRGQNRIVLAGVALRRADVANAFVAVLEVVPAYKASSSNSCLMQVGKAFNGALRAVFGRAKQRFGAGVAITSART